MAERHGLREALQDDVEGMLEAHAGRPRLQHILLEETPLPPRVHDALLEAERQGAKAVAGLLRLYPEVTRADPGRAAFLLVQTVETLTHRFAAHPGDGGLERGEPVGELVAMLLAYVTTA